MAAEKSQSTFEMPEKSFTAEFWVGLFTLIGVGCFGYLAINLAGMRLSDVGFYDIVAEFDSVSGLKDGATVEIAGVVIGEVTSVTLNDTSALVSMKVKNEVKLRDDDIAAIRTKGIIGDRYVKISPGGSEEYLSNGSKLTDTESAVEFEEIIGKFIHGMKEE